MKHLFITLLLLFLDFFTLQAQNNLISLGGGVSATSRILDFSNTDFAKEEQEQIRNLETLKPSYEIQLAYIIDNEKSIGYEVGLGFRKLRFGTKIYTKPFDVLQNAPQYTKQKQVVEQNQYMVYFMPIFKKFHPLKSSSSFLKVDLIHNQGTYQIYEPHYTQNLDKGLVNKGASSRYTFKPFDLSLSAGFNYDIRLRQSKLVIRPIVTLLFQQYITKGAYNHDYFNFNKDIKGMIWSTGLSLHYQFPSSFFKKL